MPSNTALLTLTRSILLNFQQNRAHSQCKKILNGLA
ncbi:hypothetical protein HD_0336 [[Haemophilus] ducreyi 35000HP]|uniref:Uncharacterized protein n=1 Tax=Haemophilus ducreyi (strain 35000HP / ATCC 700724) TaxID=233412 RepID=Q7VNY5_HAEDU|nr:hypothetical protein HD_0336 [[Haemophilus] ducreyi 35000HP]